MRHTWLLKTEGGEPVKVTLTCEYDEVIDAPLDPQYLIDLLGNAEWMPSRVNVKFREKKDQEALAWIRAVREHGLDAANEMFPDRK